MYRKMYITNNNKETNNMFQDFHEDGLYRSRHFIRMGVDGEQTKDNYSYRQLHLFHQIKLLKVDELNMKKNDSHIMKKVLQHIDDMKTDELKEKLKRTLLDEEFTFVNNSIEMMYSHFYGESKEGFKIDIDYSISNILDFQHSDVIQECLEYDTDLDSTSLFEVDGREKFYDIENDSELLDLDNGKIYKTIFNMTSTKYNNMIKRCEKYYDETKDIYRHGYSKETRLNGFGLEHYTNRFRYYDYVNNFIKKVQNL